MRVPAMDIIGNKIKIKYDNLEWNQREPYLDIFTDIEQVKAYCGGFGNDVESTTCWLDAYNWSLMNKSKLTEDIYQFISHRAGIIRSGIDNEIANWSGFNWDVFKPLWDQFLASGTLDLILSILEVFGL